MFVIVGADVESGGGEGGKMKVPSLVGSTAVMVVDGTASVENNVEFISIGLEGKYFNAEGSIDVG